MARTVWYCFAPGCLHQEAFESAIQRHVFQHHGVGSVQQERGVDFGDWMELMQMCAGREGRSASVWVGFALRLASLRGADDFVFEAGG